MASKKGVSPFALCAFVCNTCLIFFAVLALLVFSPFSLTDDAARTMERLVFVIIILTLTISNLYIVGAFPKKR